MAKGLLLIWTALDYNQKNNKIKSKVDKKLHIIAKDVVTQKGDIIITKNQFLNLLADLGAYKELPATKIILNALFKADF